MSKRVLLKVSGELFKASDACFDFGKILKLAEVIKNFKDSNDLELGIVVGGGNVWRFRDNSDLNLNRVVSDRLGMTGTVMNGVLLQQALLSVGDSAVVSSSVEVSNLVDSMKIDEVGSSLEFGGTVIFAGGTGNPFYSTDSAAVLKALELECDVLLKATKVAGVYDSDPEENKNAKRYKEISHHEAIVDELKVMDLTAMSMARDENLEIIVFDFSKPENLMKVFTDREIGTIVRSN